MSYDQIIYRAPPNIAPMSEWDKDYSIAIESLSEIKNMFECILGKLKWNNYENGGCWSEGCFTEHRFEINLSGDNENTGLITLRGCSQEQAIELAKKLKLSAFDPQTGEQLVL